MFYKKVLSVILTAAMLFNMSGTVMAEEAANVPAATEIPGTVSYVEKYSEAMEYATGFATIDAEKAVKDRAQYLGTEYHKKVSNAGEFAAAIKAAREGKVKIIELTEDINLGYNNFSADEQTAYKNFMTQYKKPSPNKSISTMTELGGFTNPEALKNGVSAFKISEINGLTIFSEKGNSISYAEININRNANDIVIRNIHFKNMWQWDDDGNQKAVGWSNLKLNEGHNIWIDHCTFDAAFDGNIDIENGASGLSITWCKIGQTPEEATCSGNAIYDSITFMESLYSEGKLTTGIYKNMRDAGATPEQVMQYSAYHDKCHLCGSGDKDLIDYSDTIRDSNGNIRVTLAYNYYLSIGQRLPMIRQGAGHLFNCYIDDTLRQEILKVPAIAANATSNYKMSRCLNARNGASIAADTCVFNGVEQPVIGAEVQGMDLGNMDGRYQVFFKNAVNRSLVVNSKVVNSKGTYIGSSWDNEGKNAFTTNFNWNDKSTIGNWAWSSTITNIEGYTKEDIEGKTSKIITPFEFEYKYNTDEVLPYAYAVMPIEEVETIVPAKAGCKAASGKTAAQWCTVYAANPVKRTDEKAVGAVEKIAAIGNVELTDECLAKIETAREAYKSLTRNTALVENYGELVAAEEKYAALAAEAKEKAEAEAKEKAEAEALKTEETKDSENNFDVSVMKQQNESGAVDKTQAKTDTTLVSEQGKKLVVKAIAGDEHVAPGVYNLTLNAGTKYLLNDDFYIVSAHNGTELLSSDKAAAKQIKKLAQAKAKNGATTLTVKAVKNASSYKLTLKNSPDEGTEAAIINITVNNLVLDKKYPVNAGGKAVVYLKTVDGKESNMMSAKWTCGKTEIPVLTAAEAQDVTKQASIVKGKVSAGVYVDALSGRVVVTTSPESKGSIKLTAVMNKKKYNTTVKISAAGK